MKKKVLLIMPETCRYDPYEWVPTSLIFLATLLKKKGYSPVIIDDRVQSRKQTLKLIKQNIDETLLVGLATASGIQLLHTLQLLKEIKGLKKDIPVVLGGAMASAVPELMLSDKNVDYVISGQGEHAICLLCNASESEDLNMLNKIPNIYFRMDGTIIKPEAVFERVNIEDMPPLCYGDEDVLDINRYINPNTRALNYNTSVGCIGNCTFCYWPKDYCYSRFSNDRVISDLKYLIKKYKLRNITLDDPIFFLNHNINIPLVERIVEEGLNIKWRANGRVDTLNNFSSEDIDLLIKSGCHLIHIGMESGSERILKLMNKNIYVEDGLKLAEKFAGKDIHIRLHLILGIPTEELNDIKLTAELVKRIGKINKKFDYTVNLFIPYPGNILTSLAVKNGYVPPKTLADYIDVELLQCKGRKAGDCSPLPSQWDIDYKLPWFSEEFNKRHTEAFHMLIPEISSIVSVDEKTYTFNSKRDQFS